jgi:uncharacterized protein involved in exopolysaccharide biosynthesis
VDNDGYIVTSRPSGGAKGSGTRFWFRAAEVFFRRWPLYLLPIVLLFGVGVMQAKKTAVSYQSVGTLNVTSNPFVSSPSSATPAFNAYETPASAMSRRINELLSTDSFMGSVATTAGLQGAIDADLLTLADVRKSVFATPGGDTVLRVVTTWGDANTAFQLADSTIKGYLAYVVATVSTTSKDAVDFYQKLVDQATKDVATAQKNLDKFVASLGVLPDGAELNPGQQLQLDGFKDKLARAQAQLDTGQTAIQAAQLDVQKAESQAGQTLTVVDEPEVPKAPASTSKQKVVTLAMFAILGLVVAAAAVILTTLLDAAVRSAADVVPTGLVVVATVPVVRILTRRGKSKALATAAHQSKRKPKPAGGALAAR